MEQNKTSKYVKYAVGEIVLVVIGILIALQINNWNLNRTNAKTELEYVESLIDEVSKDTAYFSSIKEQFERKHLALKKVIEILQQDSFELEDSLQFLNDYRSAGSISLWYNEPVTWAQLIHTGELKLIKKKEIIHALFNYYNSVKKTADNYNQHPLQLTNEARASVLIPFKYEPIESYASVKFTEIPRDQVFNNIWDNKEEYLELYVNINFVSMVNQVIMSNLERLSKQTLKLLEEYHSSIQ